MQKGQINPTRMELTRLKRKYATALRGHKLLKDKRDELMRRFLELARENRALRRRVEEGLRASAADFALARAVAPPQTVDAALLAPAQEVEIDAGEAGLTKPSVVRILNLLMEQGMIVKEYYGKIYLTDRGIWVAKRVQQELDAILAHFPPVSGELTGEEQWNAALAMTSALPQRLFTADYERMVEGEEDCAAAQMI